MNKEKEPSTYTLHDLMDEIHKIVPTTLEQRKEIAALIKTHGHNDKYGVYSQMWFFCQPWPRNSMKKRQAKKNNHEMLRRFRDGFLKSKMKTHAENNWGHIDTNREWCEKYIRQPEPCVDCGEKTKEMIFDGDQSFNLCDKCRDLRIKTYTS